VGGCRDKGSFMAVIANKILELCGLVTFATTMEYFSFYL
jgi:hypothetical protein